MPSKIIISCLLLLISSISFSADDFHHFAFANYLGGGIYHASGQDTTVFNIPLSFELQKSKTDTLSLHTPISLGFFNFALEDLPQDGLPRNMGTMTFIPGIYYEHKVSENYTYQTYLDLGYGKNFSSNNNLGIASIGVSSLIRLNSKKYDPLWVTRLYYVGYRSFSSQENTGFSALQTGIDLGLGFRSYSTLFQTEVEPRIFAVGYLYFNRFNIASPFKKNSLLSNGIEFGTSFTFSKPILWDWMGIDRVGISYRVSDDITAWRLVFGFPI